MRAEEEEGGATQTLSGQQALAQLLRSVKRTQLCARSSEIILRTDSGRRLAYPGLEGNEALHPACCSQLSH